MRIEFIYCPRSGDRVFAEGLGVAIYIHPNGCRHIGCADVVSVWSAEARQHFRAEGTNFLIRAVRYLGGAAWDVKGELLYAAPNPEAAGAVRLGLAYVGQENLVEGQRLLMDDWLERDSGSAPPLTMATRPRRPHSDQECGGKKRGPGLRGRGTGGRGTGDDPPGV
jgi:hypothetical protein